MSEQHDPTDPTAGAWAAFDAWLADQPEEVREDLDRLDQVRLYAEACK